MHLSPGFPICIQFVSEPIRSGHGPTRTLNFSMLEAAVEALQVETWTWRNFDKGFCELGKTARDFQELIQNFD